MDLITVRWFLAVAEHGHVTRAAAELRVSQPGVSRAIGRLERELGTVLFDREGRSVRLSRYGEVFREHARRLVAEEESARRALALAADPGHGELRLGFLHTQGATLVPDLIRRYRRRYPHVTFRLLQDSSARMQAAVRAGDADFAIISPRPDDPAFSWWPLVTERLLLAVPAGHRLARRSRVRLADVAGERFIAMRPGYGLRTITDELTRQAGIRPEIAFEGEEISTVRGLVGAGLGVAIVPPPEQGDGVRHLPIGDPGASRTLGLIWVTDRTRTPVVENFRAFATGEDGDPGSAP
ncbi:LysR family transcriptional regulator [Actinomadura alba]|uniref:LysR family transcriptional regulator n=1 Tax=Actinomadura alba TaxID=406431 RepID=A0ABR7LYN3_9ACTN|nr:LysR family transcriptional regulator [Actinomadura alba]MBC6469969.1 LysR family transcriptional regulator [Actinomadura alba]